MARKPLLGTPVLNREDVQSRLTGEARENDVMSRVIASDAAKHGRAASPLPVDADTSMDSGTSVEAGLVEADGPEEALEQPESKELGTQLSTQSRTEVINQVSV